MVDIDSKDLKILYELDKDSRQSNSKIGRKLRLSKEVVKYRIDRMAENGIIVKFNTVTNYFKLGYSKYRLFLRFKDVDKERIEEIGDYFRENGKAEWVVSCTGRWDMIVTFHLRNVNEFDGEMQEMMNRFSRFIQEKATGTTLHLVHHLREYLLEKHVREPKPVVYHSSADEQFTVDDTDTEILRMLANNARMSVVEMGRRLGLTPRTVQYRMRRLEKGSVILAYKVIVNPKRMGNIFCKAIIFLASSNRERIEEFVNYCSSIPEAVWPQRVIGTWDFEIDFEIESYDSFQERLFEIKEKFSDIIQKHEFTITSKEFKLDMFPDCYPTYG
jgi:DNA-binding Lrp family transcriptional regulator